MTDRVMFDADGAPAEYPGHDVTVAAGYLTGGRNNGWTAEEWARVRSWEPIASLLPVYVASPQETPTEAGIATVEQLGAHGFGQGATACLDMEHDEFAELVDAGYPARWVSQVEADGFLPLVYCSLDNLDDLRRTGYSGPAWVAQWTGEPHPIDGAVAVQWDGGPGKPIDLSTIYGNLALWPARDPQEGDGMANGVTILSTPSGAGYYVVDADGGVFCYGDATFHGSMGGKHLNKPIVGGAVHPQGGGYWLLGEDNGVFAFGKCHYLGSPNDTKQPHHAGPHSDPNAEARAAADAAAGRAPTALPVGPNPPPDL